MQTISAACSDTRSRIACMPPDQRSTVEAGDLTQALRVGAQLYSWWTSTQHEWKAAGYDPDFIGDPKAARGPTRGKYSHIARMERYRRRKASESRASDQRKKSSDWVNFACICGAFIPLHDHGTPLLHRCCVSTICSSVLSARHELSLASPGPCTIHHDYIHLKQFELWHSCS